MNIEDGHMGYVFLCLALLVMLAYMAIEEKPLRGPEDCPASNVLCWKDLPE